MKPNATPLTATLSGAWCILGLGSLSHWEKSHHLSAGVHNILFLAAGAVFFFAPIYIFVVGSESHNIRIPLLGEFPNPHWAQAKALGIRVICWIAGMIVCGLALRPYLQ